MTLTTNEGHFYVEGVDNIAPPVIFVAGKLLDKNVE